MEIQDALKYPFEKLIYFVAALIPGSVALLIYHVTSGAGLRWFISLQGLSYGTKRWALVLVAFVIGLSLTNLLRALAPQVGFLFGYVFGWIRPWRSPFVFEEKSAPWRDLEWRKAAKRRLGDAAPNDTALYTADLMKHESEMVQFMPPEQQYEQRRVILQKRLDTINDDVKWSQLYKHYHQRLTEPNEQDITIHIQSGLSDNFLTAALYVLGTAAFFPAVRHWWCIAPAVIWIIAALAEFIGKLQSSTTYWSTLQAQIDQLSSGQL